MKEGKKGAERGGGQCSLTFRVAHTPIIILWREGGRGVVKNLTKRKDVGGVNNPENLDDAVCSCPLTRLPMRERAKQGRAGGLPVVVRAHGLVDRYVLSTW